MIVTDFLDSLEKNSRFESQLAEHRYISPIEPRYRKLDLSEGLSGILKGRGIDRLWSHQVEAIDLIRQGENVVVMTPTASGKTLIYNIPVIESLIEDPGAKALYIFPLKGLEQDQVKNLNELFLAVGIHAAGARLNVPGKKSTRGKTLEPAEVYDGDTTPYKRKKIREILPPVIFTNPDMLHLAINPFHAKWEAFSGGCVTSW